MPYHVTLSAGEFRPFGESYSLFGYKITDNNGNAYCQFSDFSEEVFRSRYPTAADLWSDALCNEAFQALDFQYGQDEILVMDPDNPSVPAGGEDYILIGFERWST